MRVQGQGGDDDGEGVAADQFQDQGSGPGAAGAGRGSEYVPRGQTGGEPRVHLHDETGELFSLPAGWTDVVPADPFAVIADGRCPFTIDGLLALADLIGRLRSQPGSDEAVKRITP